MIVFQKRKKKLFWVLARGRGRGMSGQGGSWQRAISPFSGRGRGISRRHQGDQFPGKTTTAFSPTTAMGLFPEGGNLTPLLSLESLVSPSSPSQIDDEVIGAKKSFSQKREPTTDMDCGLRNRLLRIKRPVPSSKIHNKKLVKEWMADCLTFLGVRHQPELDPLYLDRFGPGQPRRS